MLIKEENIDKAEIERNADRESKLMAFPDPHTTNGVVVVLTKHNHAAERVLSHPIQSLKHT